MLNCTPAYMDPLVDEGMVDKAAMWSVGVMLFELVCGRLPFGTLGTASQFETYLRNAGDAAYELTEHENHRLGDQFKDIIARIFTPDYRERISLSEFCDLQFVQSNKDYWELVEERQKEYDMRVHQYAEFSQMKYQLKKSKAELVENQRLLCETEDKNRLEMATLKEQLNILVYELEEQTKYGK